MQARRERRNDRFASLTLESPLRQLDRIVDFAKTIDEILRRSWAGKLREARNAGVDAVEKRRLITLHLTGQRRLDELIRRRGRTGQRQELRHALALVHAPRFGADLGVGLAKQRIVRREVQPEDLRSRCLIASGPALVEVVLLRLPRAQPVL